MGFEFEKQDTIEILGKDYVCDTADAGIMRGIVEVYPRVKTKFAMLGTYQTRITEIQAELQELIKNSKDSAQTQNLDLEVEKISKQAQDCSKEFLNAIDEAVADAASFITAIMGEDDYIQAFKGREKDTKAHIKLCEYIHDYAIKKRSEVTEPYKLPVNRAQRRAKKPKVASDNEPVTISE